MSKTLRRAAATIAALVLALAGVLVGATPAFAAPFVVDTTSDNPLDGLTLREAIDAANANADPSNSISFTPALSGQTLQINSALPDIEKSLSITGLGSANLSIERTGSGRFFRFTPTAAGQTFMVGGITFVGDGIDDGPAFETAGAFGAANITLAGVVFNDLTNAVSGGAVQVGDVTGTFFLNGCDFNGNHATASGGAVWVSNTTNLIIYGNTYDGNVAETAAGGAVGMTGVGSLTVESTDFESDNSAATQGGGIGAQNLGSAVILDTRFVGNTAGTWGGGAYLHGGTSTTVEASYFYDNTADFGGGLYVDGVDGPVDLTEGTELDSNHAIDGDGGGVLIDGLSTELTVTDARLNNNDATGWGGGLRVDSASTVVARDSSFTLNTAELDGGGMSVESFTTSVLVETSAFSLNEAYDSGGGLALFTVSAETSATVRASQFTGNASGSGVGGGFGVASNAGVIEIDSSTFTSNVLDPDGDGVGFGLAEVNQGTIDVVNSTFDELFETDEAYAAYVGGNGSDGSVLVRSSTLFGPGALAIDDNDGATTLENSIFSATGSLPAAGVGGGSALGASYSLFSTPFDPADVASATTNRFSVADMGLGALALNGGPTETRLPADTSPAVNAGNAAAANLPAFDQRGDGFPRVLGGALDIGAVETDVERVLPATGSSVPAWIVALGGLLLLAGAGLLVARRRSRQV